MGDKHSVDGVFTRRDIVRIRQGIKSGIPSEVYADEFKVSLQCIRDLALGRTHKDVNKDESPAEEPTRTHLKAQQKRTRVLELLKEGELSQASIAKLVGVSQSYVSLIKDDKR